MNRTKRFLSVLLITAMMISLLPSLTLMAAGTPTIEFSNLYAPDSTEYVNQDVNKLPADLSLITRMTSNNVTLKGNFYNFDPSQVENFYYTVTAVKPDNTQTTITYDKNKAQITGSTTFEFRNVILNEGLNKIVIYSANGDTSSKAGWVYFNPATTITDLQVNGEEFKNGMIVPQDPVNDGSGLVVTGYAPNAKNVVIQVMGESTPYSGYFNSQTGYFQFKIDKLSSTRVADIKLDSGDHKFDIIATNDTQKMTLTRSFIYNDGTPFIFGNIIGDVTTFSSVSKELVTQPVIEGTSNSVHLEGYIKVDIDPTNLSLMYDKVTINTGAGSETFDLGTLTGDLGGVIALDSTRTTPLFNVYQYKTNLPVDPNTRSQRIIAQFIQGVITSTAPILTFDYLNTSFPYISEVKLKDTNISLIDGTQVNELPITLTITPKNATDFQGVKIYYDNSIALPEVTKASNTEYIINWLPEGNHQLKFVPMNSAGEQQVGSITRSVNYVPMQYIILNNIYNGQIFEAYSNIPNPLEGRLINVPTNNQIEVFIGDKEVYFVRNTDNSFTVDLKKDGTGAALTSQIIKEGMNSIKFLIRDPNNAIIAESNWDIYLFTTKSPQLLMNIDPAVADYFINTSELQQGQYVTKEKKVFLDGSFKEASKITVHIYRKDEYGNKDLPIVGEWKYNGSTFETVKALKNPDEMDIDVLERMTNGTAIGKFDLDVDLNQLGTTTIQVQITNVSGIISNKTFEILREPLPYEIVYPNLQRTNVVNSNFVRIEMVAEGADAVYFKKDVARKGWIIDRSGNDVEGFIYEVKDLKPGKNKIKFSVVRGDQEISGEIEIVNANTNIEGATYKTPIEKRIKAFDGLVEIEFPKGTMLRRNDENTINPYLSDQRQILFGIAENQYGRVDKYRHPLSTELQKDRYNDGNRIDNFYPSIDRAARIGGLYLEEPTGRFRPASQLIWIDAGVISENASDQEEIIYGSGLLPYDSDYLFYERYPEDQAIPTQRGTITLKYNESIRSDAWPYLTIQQYAYNPDKDLYEWINLGGVVDSRNNTISSPVDSFGYFRVMYMNQSFDDVIGHNWARIDLDTLYSKGIMKNKFSDQFRPEENISRGEFVTLLVKAFELPLDYEGTATFYDVYRNPRVVGNALYEYKYIETAARYGIVRGQLQGTFAPDESINRQDAAVMIARAADLKMSSLTSEKMLEKTTANLQKLFTDANLIDLYAKPAVEAVYKAGLISGKPNIMLEGQKKATYRFDPTFELKRSEAARVIMNVLKQLKKVPK